MPDDHVTTFRSLWRGLGHLFRVIACIISNSKVDVALSSTEDKLSSSDMAAARIGDQTTGCSNDESDDLSMSMVTQLGRCSGAVRDGNIL